MTQMFIFRGEIEEIKENGMFKDIIERFAPKIEKLKESEERHAPDSLVAMVLEMWESFEGALVVIESDPVKEIRCTVEFLREARLEEARRGYLLAGKRADLTRKEGSVKARSKSIVSRAYVDELITGKNAEIRKSQEYQLISEDELIASYENEASEIRSVIVDLNTEYDTSTITRRYFEELLSSQRAVLLFLSRTENL